MTRDSIDEFEELAAATAVPLYRSAWLLCGDRYLAQDLVQDTLAKVYVRMGRRWSAPVENPAGYAHATLVRTFISHRRRKTRELPYADLPETASGDPADLSQLRLALQQALAELKPIDRAVVVLRYLEDLPVEQVAERLDMSSSAVKSRSMRALARMREGNLQ